MSVSTMDVNTRLTKLLNLTTSNFDGECLNSIRAANTLLDKHGIRWDDILDDTKSFQIINQLKSEIITLKMRETPDTRIKIIDKLNECLSHRPDNKFIKSLKDSYGRYGKLTEKQIDVLNKMWGEL